MVLLALAAAPPAPGGAGATLRTSRQVVTLRVTNDGRELARLSVPERGRARVSREGGETLGLTPEIQGDRLKLVVSLQTAYGPNGPVFTPWKTYSLAPDVPTTIDTGQTRFEIEWVAAATKPAPETLTDGCRECCITCFEFTYCACEVITPCGRCCCPETCGCIIITESLATPGSGLAVVSKQWAPVAGPSGAPTGSRGRVARSTYQLLGGLYHGLLRLRQMRQMPLLHQPDWTM
jgi:hypothetical protein